MTISPVLSDVAAQGWRLWTLGEGIDGLWRAKLYRPERLADVPFSADGIGATPDDAIRACLDGPPSTSLYDEATLHLRRPPAFRGADAMRRLADARAALTRSIRA